MLVQRRIIVLIHIVILLNEYTFWTRCNNTIFIIKYIPNKLRYLVQVYKCTKYNRLFKGPNEIHPSGVKQKYKPTGDLKSSTKARKLLFSNFINPLPNI